LSRQICIYFMDRQQRLANYLNSKVKPVRKGRIRYALIAFCIVTGSYFLYLIARAFGVFH
jgi:hypothetical protein